MFGKRVGFMRRGGLLKRSAPLRPSGPPKAKARLKRGAPSPFRVRVKMLHRAVVMLRAGAVISSKTFRTVSWNGPCQVCGRRASLVVSHLYPQGKYPASAYLADNSLAKCAPCHDWWHANPLDAWEWLLGLIGQERFDVLRAEVRSRNRIDLAHDAAVLVHQVRALGRHENDVIPEGTWARAS